MSSTDYWEAKPVMTNCCFWAEWMRVTGRPGLNLFLQNSYPVTIHHIFENWTNALLILLLRDFGTYGTHISKETLA